MPAGSLPHGAAEEDKGAGDGTRREGSPDREAERAHGEAEDARGLLEGV